VEAVLTLRFLPSENLLAGKVGMSKYVLLKVRKISWTVLVVQQKQVENAFLFLGEMVRFSW
jgi:hypothetical protein